MSKGKFKLNKAGVLKLFKSEAMQRVIKEYTTTVNNNAGTDYGHNVQVHHRVVGRVYARNYRGRKDNYENNTLLKALHR